MCLKGWTKDFSGMIEIGSHEPKRDKECRISSSGETPSDREGDEEGLEGELNI